MRTKLDTIEDLLHSRQHYPALTLKLLKDIARRIKKLEAKENDIKNKI